MKNKILIISMLFAALFAACQGEDKPKSPAEANALTLSTEKLNYDPTGQAVGAQTSVTVKSSSDWRLTGSQTWCRPSVSAGKSGDQVTFEVQTNDTETPREALYFFICGDKTQKLRVTQDVVEVIDFNDAVRSFDLNSEQGAITLKVRSNVQFDCEIEQDGLNWVVAELTGAANSGERWLRLGYTANDTFAPRSTKIRILDSKAAERTVIALNQAQNNDIQVDKQSFDLEHAGGSIQIHLRRNVEYNITIPASYQSWIERTTPTRALTESDETFVIRAGDEHLRIGKIKIVSTDGAINREISIRQQGSAVAVYAEIPDANFRKYLSDNDFIVVRDGNKCELTGAGINTTAINCAPLQSIPDPATLILSLTGIEAFAKIQTLDCSGNQITALDVSRNTALQTLTCANNLLETLTLGQNSALQTLTASNNRLKALDLSGVPNLTSLYINRNYVQRFDFSANLQLTATLLSDNPVSYLNLGDQEVGMSESDNYTCSNNNSPDGASPKRLRVDSRKVQYLQLASTNIEELDLIDCPNLKALIALSFGGVTRLKKVYVRNKAAISQDYVMISGLEWVETTEHPE